MRPIMERQAPEMAQISKATDKGFRLVADASDETLRAIDRGDIVFYSPLKDEENSPTPVKAWMRYDQVWREEQQRCP